MSEIQIDTQPVPPIDEPIESLFEQASRLDDEIKAREAEIITPLVEQKAEIEAVIRERCLQGGATIKTPYGNVTFRQPGSRVSWDDKKLLAIVADLSAAGHANTVARLMACRTVTPTAAGTSISYKGGEK